MFFKKNPHIIILILILLSGFIFRLYRFDNPIADWHSWRQADTSAVSRNFVREGFDILHPRFDDLSNVASGMDNPEGFRFVEFPLYNIKQAFLYKYVGVLSLEQWGRMVSIISSVLAGVFLYLIASRHSNKKIGLLSAFFYMFIPYNIYYGRTILPDTMMAMSILGGIYFFDKWIEDKSKVIHSASSGRENQKSKTQINNKNTLYLALAAVFTASALLLKPYAVFFTLPMIVLAYDKFGFGLFRNWQLWFFAVFSLAPLLWWRNWITQFPEGIPANQWLLNGNGIRFRPAFFRWIGYERIIKLISGYLGAIILVFGLLKVFRLKEWLFFASFLASSALYVTVFATGNVQHDYYQILIMPTLSIFFAIGAYYLWGLRFKKLPIGIFILAVSLAGLFWFGWMQVRDYFNINNRSIVVAGEAVDRLTSTDAKVIANYNGDTSFLYQTKRRGWASFQNPLPEMIKKGADYLVLVNPTVQDMVFEESYQVVEKTPQYVIFDLRSN
jgi:4-amino-4-deoxy-L-arabinose transferase-like glycosyltransferase